MNEMIDHLKRQAANSRHKARLTRASITQALIDLERQKEESVEWDKFADECDKLIKQYEQPEQSDADKLSRIAAATEKLAEQFNSVSAGGNSLLVEKS